MDARLQLRVQRYGWDRAAARYDASWERPLSAARALLVDRLRPRPGERILDVACGTGGLALELAAAVGPAGEVLGIDLSQAMVDAATAQDAQSLSLPDAGCRIRRGHLLLRPHVPA